MAIPFPFDEFETPPFRMTHTWDSDRLLGYLRTWSASLLYEKKIGRAPTDEIRAELTAVWGDPNEERKITWDLRLRAKNSPIRPIGSHRLLP